MSLNACPRCSYPTLGRDGDRLRCPECDASVAADALVIPIVDSTGQLARSPILVAFLVLVIGLPGFLFLDEGLRSGEGLFLAIGGIGLVAALGVPVSALRRARRPDLSPPPRLEVSGSQIVLWRGRPRRRIPASRIRRAWLTRRQAGDRTALQLWLQVAAGIYLARDLELTEIEHRRVAARFAELWP